MRLFWFDLEHFLNVLSVILKEALNFSVLDFKEIRYADPVLPMTVGLVLLISLLVKILWRGLRKEKSSQKQTSHETNRYFWRGRATTWLFNFPKLILVFGVSGLLLALAEPFIDQIKEDKKVVASRIRVDLRDGSSSMEELFPDSLKTKAQVAAEAHFEFLEMRRGKNDRVSFWIFASFPHLLENFIVDDELYSQQVEDGPWLVWGGSIADWFKNNSQWPKRIPFWRYAEISGESGGTDMILALQAIIKQFDQDEKRLHRLRTGGQLVARSVLMITDAEVSAFPEEQLEALRQRNIRPYLIWIKGLSPVVPEFAKRVRDYGGEYFDVEDEKSLKRAYQAIDQLEDQKVEISRKFLKWPLFQNFLLWAVIILFIALLVILLTEPFGVYP